MIRHFEGMIRHFGDVYVGDWKDDRKHGKGIYKYADGDHLDDCISSYQTQHST